MRHHYMPRGLNDGLELGGLRGAGGAGFSSCLYCSRLRLPTSFPDGETPRTVNMGLYAGIPEISVSPAPVPPRAHPGR